MFSFWRSSLENFLSWFINKRAGTKYFYQKVFALFIALNLACYWWALLTTYPQHLLSYKADEYVLMGFPVSLMGALFDSLSLFVTVFIVKRALRSENNLHYIAFLSVDLLIAVLATFWVLFAFVASGWMVSLILERPETFAYRTELYEGRFWSVLLNPFAPDNIRNIYFGLIMGASALLPTLCHLYMAGLSVMRFMMRKQGFYKAVFYIGILMIGALSLLPQTSILQTGVSDKIEHFMAYGVLCLSGCLAFPNGKMRILLGLMLYGIVLEGLQSFIPGRVSSMADIFANCFGVGIGYISLWGYYKSRSV